MRALAVLMFVAGCYDPSAVAGAPCAANDTRPENLECRGGYCLLPGAAVDSPGDGSPDLDSTIDAPPGIDSTIDAPPGMGWSAPVPITEANSASTEGDPSVTADRLQLYFISNRAGGVGGDDIWYTKRASVGSAWDPPTNVTALNSTSTEASVEISSDGSQVFLVSSRSGNTDVYSSTLAGTAWSAPAVVAELTTATPESDVAVSPDGLTAIVARGSSGSRTLLLATRATTAGAFGALTPVTGVNGVATDPAAPSLTNGADTIYFHGDGTRNIYVTTKAGASWSAPAAVAEVNTAMRDAAPFITPANDYLVFERAGNLYVTSR